MALSTDIHCWNAFGSWAMASATGMVVVAALGLWGQYFSRSISLRIYLVVFTVFTLSMASLLAWQKEHRESGRAENLATLRAFNSEANRLFDESLALNDAADFAAYTAKANGFSARLERWVAENIGPRASEILLRHDPKDANMTFENTMGKDHAAAIVAIIQTRENVAALIEARASDRCVKPPTAEHPIPQAID
ncbi:MAG TPA: hypothetical protein VKS24_00915 [Bradyrhizobium sp.]|jgi:hypothetical protein|nr:hypothetical protein [Bradyrhizobium sp.]